MSSFLQSQEWAEFQKSLGHEVFSVDTGNISTQVVKHELRGRNYLYLPWGPEVNFNAMTGGIENEFRSFIGQLKKLAREQKSIFIKAEPMTDTIAQQLVHHGFRRTNKAVMPHRSVIIDLEENLDDILVGMHHKTRYNIKVAEKHGIKVEDSHDIDAFWKLLQNTTKRDKFSSHPKDYYKTLLEFFGKDGEIHHVKSGEAGAQNEHFNRVKTDLILAFCENRPVAGAIVLLYGKTAYYLHGASDYHYRSMMAPYLLHWENIKYLKEHGFKSYDLWGINVSKWPGVTRFKLGWGGRQVEYPGSFDLPISKFWYLIYRIYRAIFK